MESTCGPDGSGLRIAEVEPGRFVEFARHHARSEEIGPIATVFDGPRDGTENAKIHTLGLFGCGALCAVSAALQTQAPDGRAGAIKLDSVIVDHRLRRRGLAGLIVAKAFHLLLSDPEKPASSIYAHAVHPATVRLLARMKFGQPPPSGAPIASRQLDRDAARQELLAQRGTHVQDASDRLRLDCCFCKTRDRRARRWCGHAGPVAAH